jgi:hypothetical protein
MVNSKTVCDGLVRSWFSIVRRNSQEKCSGTLDFDFNFLFAPDHTAWFLFGVRDRDGCKQL